MNIKQALIVALLSPIATSNLYNIGKELDTSDQKKLFGVMPTGNRFLEEEDDDPLIQKINRKLGCQSYYQGDAKLVSICLDGLKWASREFIRNKVNCVISKLKFPDEPTVTDEPTEIKIPVDNIITIGSGVQLSFNPYSKETATIFVKAVKNCQPKQKPGVSNNPTTYDLDSDVIQEINTKLAKYKPQFVTMKASSSSTIIQFTLPDGRTIQVTPQGTSTLQTGQNTDTGFFEFTYAPPRLRGNNSPYLNIIAEKRRPIDATNSEFHFSYNLPNQDGSILHVTFNYDSTNLAPHH